MATIRTLHIPIAEPAEIIPRLGKPTHWKPGRSAHSLATSWVRANGFPPRVAAVLAGDRDYRDARFVTGIFERQTALRSAGNPSQTDLLALAAINGSLVVIGVEGKVDEPFGESVDVWDDRSRGKTDRLAGLCKTLAIDPATCRALRYQLLHRCAAAIYEAQNFCSRHALMLVHSFSPEHACFDDFRNFSHAIGMAVEEPDRLSAARTLENVSFRLGWVSDRPPTD